VNLQPSCGEITRLLAQWTESGLDAVPELWSVLYRALRKIANACMRSERPYHTLQTTALVNEAYLRVVRDKPLRWENRTHFLGAMAQAMRNVLVDHARELFAKTRRRMVPWSDQKLPYLPPTRSYAVAPDGTRIVAIIPAANSERDRAQHHITFLLNFFDDLRRRAPTGGGLTP
jgi:hypothetical protein